MSYHYWPSEQDKPWIYGKLTVKKLSQENFGDFILRKFEIDERKQDTTCTSQDRLKTSFTITQIQFTVWPEYGTHPSTSSLVELVNRVNKVQMGTGNRPMIVMCKYVIINFHALNRLQLLVDSDGMGRSGTFICIHAQLERLKTEGVVDFFQFVKSARTQRPGVILNVVSQPSFLATL